MKLSVAAALGAFLVLCGLGCDGEGAPGNASATPSPASKTQQVFQVRGVVKSIAPDGKTMDVRHEEIPGYMPAMTMPFDVKQPSEVKGIQAGQTITFRLNVTGEDSWIDQVKAVEGTAAGNAAAVVTNNAAVSNTLPADSGLRIVRDVEPLNVGDPLPAYHFTNEQGAPIVTTQYKGQAVAITFIFTRCPLPNFCPRMSGNFEEAQKKLLAEGKGKNWHLLTISFDPTFDTPVILKAYAQRYGADPNHWSFLTGDLTETTALSEQFGQLFWRDQGSINHNLRTIVIDAQGKVQRIFEGNKWTSDELVAEMDQAMKAGS